MKKLLILSLLTTVTFIAKSQTIIRYKTAQGVIYTQTQIDSIIAAKNIKLKDAGMTAKIEVLDTEHVGDTVFNQYKLNITNKTVDENDIKKNKFLNLKLPDFQYKDLKGKFINSEALKGKPIILNFWFTTCLPCIAEMPELNRLKKKYKSSDIVFLSMTYETKDKVLAFLKKKKFDFQVISDAKEYCDMFTDSYPINLFVDRNGIVRNIQYGMPLLYNSQTKTVSTTSKVDPTEFERELLKIK